MPAVVAHLFNPSTREAEASGSLSFRPAATMTLSSKQNKIKKERKKGKKKEVLRNKSADCCLRLA